MSESSEQAHGRGPSQRAVEFGLAALMLAFGVMVIIGSWRAGITWGIEGPRAGFFPFYIAVLIVVGSLINLARAVSAGPVARRFADWDQLYRVLTVVVPAAIYVAIVPWLGIYVASALLIGLFMKWLGRYGWNLSLVLAVGLPIFLYVLFERWFLIPLPKGPLEDWLGL